MRRLRIRRGPDLLKVASSERTGHLLLPCQTKLLVAWVREWIVWFDNGRLYRKACYFSFLWVCGPSDCRTHGAGLGRLGNGRVADELGHRDVRRGGLAWPSCLARLVVVILPVLGCPVLHHAGCGKPAAIFAIINVTCAWLGFGYRTGNSVMVTAPPGSASMLKLEPASSRIPTSG